MKQDNENKTKSRLPVFRERLNELLGDMNITDFAKKVGLTRQTMGFYLNGDRIPDISTLFQICNICNVSADWLVGLSDVISRDIQTRNIVEATGLSEKNVNFLTNPSKSFWDGPISENNESLYALINLLVECCNDWQVKDPFHAIYNLHVKDSAPADDFDLIIESMEKHARSRGYTILTVNESVEFYAAQVGKAIERNIIERYKVKERERPIGTLSEDGTEIYE